MSLMQENDFCPSYNLSLRAYIALDERPSRTIVVAISRRLADSDAAFDSWLLLGWRCGKIERPQYTPTPLRPSLLHTRLAAYVGRLSSRTAETSSSEFDSAELHKVLFLHDISGVVFIAIPVVNPSRPSSLKSVKISAEFFVTIGAYII